MSILLYVNAWSYEPFDFYISDTESLQDIKEQISIRVDETPDKLHLFHNNTPFSAEKLQHDDVKICGSITITCDIDAALGFINLCISHVSIKKYITIPRETTIREIKQLLSIEPDDTIAYQQWTRLNNDTPLTDLKNCSAIYIGPSDYQIGSPNQQIFIRAWGGATLSFYVDYNRPITDLSQMMELRYGVPQNLLRLLWRGRRLIETNTFNEYNIPYQETLHATLPSLGGSGIIPIGSTRIGDPPVKAKKKPGL